MDSDSDNCAINGLQNQQKPMQIYFSKEMEEGELEDDAFTEESNAANEAQTLHNSQKKTKSRKHHRGKKKTKKQKLLREDRPDFTTNDKNNDYDDDDKRNENDDYHHTAKKNNNLSPPDAKRRKTENSDYFPQSEQVTMQSSSRTKMMELISVMNDATTSMPSLLPNNVAVSSGNLANSNNFSNNHTKNNHNDINNHHQQQTNNKNNKNHNNINNHHNSRPPHHQNKKNKNANNSNNIAKVKCIKREVCKFHQRGNCRYKDDRDCPFSHDLSGLPRTVVPELCHFYATGHCEKGDEFCVYMHAEFPCKFYHLGGGDAQSDPNGQLRGSGCQMGAKCKFAHENLTPHAQEALRKMRGELTGPPPLSTFNPPTLPYFPTPHSLLPPPPPISAAAGGGEASALRGGEFGFPPNMTQPPCHAAPGFIGGNRAGPLLPTPLTPPNKWRRFEAACAQFPLNQQPIKSFASDHDNDGAAAAASLSLAPIATNSSSITVAAADDAHAVTSYSQTNLHVNLSSCVANDNKDRDLRLLMTNFAPAAQPPSNTCTQNVKSECKVDSSSGVSNSNTCAAPPADIIKSPTSSIASPNYSNQQHTSSSNVASVSVDVDTQSKVDINGYNPSISKYSCVPEPRVSGVNTKIDSKSAALANTATSSQTNGQLSISASDTDEVLKNLLNLDALKGVASFSTVTTTAAEAPATDKWVIHKLEGIEKLPYALMPIISDLPHNQADDPRFSEQNKCFLGLFSAASSSSSVASLSSMTPSTLIDTVPQPVFKVRLNEMSNVFVNSTSFSTSSTTTASSSSSSSSLSSSSIDDKNAAINSLPNPKNYLLDPRLHRRKVIRADVK